MNSNIASVVKYYKLCTKLKDIIRTGPIVWNVNRKRIESVAEDVHGTQILSLAISRYQ